MRKLLVILLFLPIACTSQVLTHTANIDGYSARFDGIDDFTYVPNFAVMNQDTFELDFTVYMYDVGTTLQWVWSYYESGTDVLYFQYNNNYVQFLFVVGGGVNRGRLTAASISDNWLNQWRNIKVEYYGKGATNADRLKISIDGATAALSFAGTIPDTVNLTGDQYFGSYGGVLFGQIRYSDCYTYIDGSLATQYTFCEGYEDSIYDVTGNNYHMSVNNTNPDFFWFWHREDTSFCAYLVQNGFELYSDGNDFVRVPYLLDGTKISPIITGFTKIANISPAYFDPKVIRIDIQNRILIQ